MSDYRILANGKPTNLYQFNGRMYERFENDGLWCYKPARRIDQDEVYE